MRSNALLRRLTEVERQQLSRYLTPLQAAAGEEVVTEGHQDRAMYWVTQGHAEIRQGDTQLGHLQAGEHFGELALISARPRAASVVATTELSLLKLSADSYERLVEQQPRIALSLLQAMVEGVGDRLAQMTHSFKTLLHERSLPRRRTVSVRVGGANGNGHFSEQSVSLGTAAQELLPQSIDGQLVVAALINRKAVALNTPISSDCELAPLTVASLEGQRIYRMSLGLLLLEAANDVPGAERVRLANSVGLGQRLSVPGLNEKTAPAMARALESRMLELAREGRALREEWWTVDEARAYFQSSGWRDIAELLRTWRDPAVPLVSYGSLYTLRMGPLLPSTQPLEKFGVLAEGIHLVLTYGRAASAPPPALTMEADDDPVDPDAAPSSGVHEALAAARQSKKMTRNTEAWLRGLHITGVGDFNAACIRGDVDELIAVSEGFHEKHLSTIADRIRNLGRRVRVITIAGPSSSGKTTFIKRLRVQLRVNGIRPIPISLDDYYVDREQTPKDAHGEYDYEALSALRLELLRDHLGRLLKGEAVRTARYDFLTGLSHEEGGQELRLEERDLVMLEGIHGLNPALLPGLTQREVFRIFVCPLAQLSFDRLARVHVSDVRLLRRIVRDRHTRGLSAADNILRWDSVRRGERRWIFPYQDCADATFDTSLPYELGVLKVYAERYLLEVPTTHPAHTAAFRLLKLVDRFVAIYPDRVPPNSLLREFIGGSSFQRVG